MVIIIKTSVCRGRRRGAITKVTITTIVQTHAAPCNISIITTRE